MTHTSWISYHKNGKLKYGTMKIAVTCNKSQGGGGMPLYKYLFKRMCSLQKSNTCHEILTVNLRNLNFHFRFLVMQHLITTYTCAGSPLWNSGASIEIGFSQNFWGFSQKEDHQFHLEFNLDNMLLDLNMLMVRSYDRLYDREVCIYLIPTCVPLYADI